MRILADENVPGTLVNLLRQRGHDVVWIRADAPGSADEAVIESARKAGRILLTSDKDFGELVFRHGLSAPDGVILLRISDKSPQNYVSKAISALESQADWTGCLVVITDQRIRVRPLSKRTFP
jgi:predicted nuclease of predicted toxin-antitoxin system